jgi:hypothetical protein
MMVDKLQFIISQMYPSDQMSHEMKQRRMRPACARSHKVYFVVYQFLAFLWEF